MNSGSGEDLERLGMPVLWIIRRMLPFLRPHARALVLVALSAVVTVATQVLWPRIFAEIAANWGGADDLHRVRFLFLSLVAVTVTGAVFEFVRAYLSEATTQRLVASMRSALYERFLRLPLDLLDRTPTGKIVSRLVNDPDALEGLLQNGFVSFVGNSLLVLAVAIAMLVTSWRLALVGFVAVPCVIGVGLIFRSTMRQAVRDVRARLSDLSVRMEENLSGHSTIVLLDQEERCAAEVGAANTDLRTASQWAMVLRSVFNPFLQGAFGFGMALVVLCGGTMVSAGTLSIGELIAFLLYMNMFSWPLQEAMERVQSLQVALASLERIFSFLDQPEDDFVTRTTSTVDGPSATSIRSGSTSTSQESPSTRPAPIGGQTRALGELEFRDVWFAYREGEWVLKGVSFRARPGQRIAIAGPTGSGKTTILNLAGALYRPQKGVILLDGRDIASLDPLFVRRQIVTVMQDVFLFNDTVLENVRLWENSITRERVDLACERAQARGFVERLPEGYSQNLGRGGATISAGQRQLLNFARALAYDPPILALDEATSWVDAQTEEAIRRGLLELTRGRTSLVVAHRFSTLADADELLEIRDGVVYRKTTPREVLGERGRDFSGEG